MVVQEYQQGLGSTSDLADKHGISKSCIIPNWGNKYDNHKALTDYDLELEVCMADIL